jgi:hypothetical protein
LRSERDVTHEALETELVVEERLGVHELPSFATARDSRQL